MKKCPFSIKKKNLKANKRKKGDKIKCLRKIFKIFKKFNHQGIAIKKKTTLWFHFTSIRMAKVYLKKNDDIDVGKGKYLFTTGVDANRCSH